MEARNFRVGEYNVSVHVLETPPNEQKILSNNHDIEKENNFQWTRASTKLLLDEYQVRKQEFRDPKIKKRELWQQIARILQKRGYDVDYALADKKFRNLKQTYEVVKNKKPNKDRRQITWEYFWQFEEIFTDDLSETINAPSIRSFQIDPLSLTGNLTSNSNEQNFKSELTSTSYDDNQNVEQDNAFKWCNASIELLLDEYQLRRDEFRDPEIRKRDLWRQIARVLRERGFDVDHSIAEKKFRNLKQTYVTVKNNKKRKGYRKTTWEYFWQFEELFADDISLSLNSSIRSAFQLDPLASTSTDNNQDTEQEIDFTWCKDSIQLLLDEYQTRKGNFHSATMKKRRDLWEEIARVLKKRGHDVDPSYAKKKFMDLKRIYDKMKKKNKRSIGNRRATWEYYWQFEEIFTDDLPINLNVPTRSSFQMEPSTSTADLSSSSNSTVNEENLESESSNPRKKPKLANDYRSRMLELEIRKIQALEKLDEHVMENNEIQKDRNHLIEELISVLKEKNNLNQNGISNI